MLFSIITINYNNREGLIKTINSVICQTFADFEFIIIDGGSTDGSKIVIENYESNISYWVSEKDNGIYHAMNKGVSHANGTYSIFMNSGDCFTSKDVLSRVAAFGCSEDIIVGNVISNRTGEILPTKPVRDFSLYHLYSVSIPHQASFIRTTLLVEIPYDESLKISSDWKFFLEALILNNCSFKFIDIVVADYDMDGISTNNPAIMRLEKDEILSSLIPHRILLDYKWMKSSECLTQTLTPQLKNRYLLDKLLYRVGSFLLKLYRCCPH